MKDKLNRIHIFEVKSVNLSHGQLFDPEEYNNKVAALKDFYCHCSAKLPNHIFYLPILDKGNWRIYRYKNGEQKSISEHEFKKSLELKDL